MPDISNGRAETDGELAVDDNVSRDVVAESRCTYHQENAEKNGFETVEQVAESVGQTPCPEIEPREETSDQPGLDNSTRAWLVVLGAWCSSFCTYGWINSVGTFQEYYETGPLHNYTPSEIAWIPALQIFFVSAMGPILGHWFDRYGPRPLLLVGSFMHVFGLMMASLSSTYYQLLLSQGVCSAVGVAAVFLAAIGSVSGWFLHRRGLAFGVLATGSSLGGVIFPIMISRLIDSVGYGWAMRSAAFIIAFMLLIANLTVRRRGSSTAQAKMTRKRAMQPFRELPYVFLLVGFGLVPFGLYTPINFLPTVGIRAGLSQSVAQNLVAFYNAASLFGRLTSGFLADRLGRFNVFVVACYMAGILIVAFWIPGVGEAATIAFAILFGFSSGAYISLMPALIAQISPLDEIGYRNGVSNLVGSIGGLTAAPIAGAILQSPNGMVGLKVFAGAFMLAGTTFVLLCRVLKTEQKLLVTF